MDPDRTQALAALFERGEVDPVLARWPRDPEMVVAASAALLDRAQRHPEDEPQPEAARAAEAVRACLARNPSHPYLLINLANALRLAGPAHREEAHAAYREALARDPSRGAWWLDFSVLHKLSGHFEEGLDCALRARARLGETRPVLFNIAVHATGLGQGDLAAGTWRRLGIPATVQEAGGMPFVDGLPFAWVRLPVRRPSGRALELARVSPLSPCHGVVVTPTAGETPADYGDVVLWDPAPAVLLEGSPAFPFLGRLRRGDEHRFPFLGLSPDPSQIASIEARLPQGAHLFVHVVRHEPLCVPCAAGPDLARDDRVRREAHRVTRGKLVLAPDVDLEAVRVAVEADPGVVLLVPDLLEALGDARAAGRHRAQWVALEADRGDGAVRDVR